MKIFHQSWGLIILRLLENGTSESVAVDIFGTPIEFQLKTSSTKSCANARGTRNQRISGLRKTDDAREREQLESRDKHLRIPLNILYLVITSTVGANTLGRR